MALDLPVLKNNEDELKFMSFDVSALENNKDDLKLPKEYQKLLDVKHDWKKYACADCALAKTNLEEMAQHFLEEGNTVI